MTSLRDFFPRDFFAMEHVFDSVCRCFGGVPATDTSGRRDRRSSAAHACSPHRGVGGTKGVASHESPETKRRTSRLELQDKEWDGLFQRNSPPPDPIQYTHASAPVNPDLEYARAVAQAKLAGANPSRKQSTTLNKKNKKKRKSPATKRDEIFRTRRFEQSTKTSSATTNHHHNVRPSSSNSLSRLLSNHPNVAQALCFATPVRDEDEEDDLPLNLEPDDDSTLNTCEDTMTSTVYFESKYADVVEKRPPMPLFSHFKVSDEQDHIRKIVATDSHNSLNMIRLFNENLTKSQEELPDSSSDEEPALPPPPPAAAPVIDRTNVLQHAIPRRRPPSTRGVDSSEPAPEPVKIDSSGSSKSTASTCPSSSSPPIPEDGSVERL